MSITKEKTIQLLLFLALIGNICVWFYGRDIRSDWQAVPPVPSKFNASSFALGDQQFSYRLIGIMLQNFGDTGGRSTALRDYNFEELTQWLYLNTSLDGQSNFTPYLASMYYGAVDDPLKLPPLLEYLSDVGHRPGGENWRWLAHAVYLARFKMQDLDLALKYAQELAALPGELPAWARQMPAFIFNAKGDKKEALAMMLEILKSGVGKYHPNEINNTVYMICTTILEPEEAKVHPLCQDLPG